MVLPAPLLPSRPKISPGSTAKLTLRTSTFPPLATSNPVATKVGTAEVTSILGLVATGDASINTAAQSAGITRISHVDYEAKSILGVYAKYTVYVYGE